MVYRLTCLVWYGPRIECKTIAFSCKSWSRSQVARKCGIITLPHNGHSAKVF
jgi:hypothetical protein